MNNSNEDFKDALYEAIETSLVYQLKAVRKLRSRHKKENISPKKSISHTDMTYYILKKVACPLHISKIISHIKCEFNKEIERESLVSALTKKVKRHDRFRRVAPNTFALLEE